MHNVFDGSNMNHSQKLKCINLVTGQRGEFIVSYAWPSSCKDALAGRQLPAERTALTCISVFESSV